jgi:hypothetical protein
MSHKSIPVILAQPKIAAHLCGWAAIGTFTSGGFQGRDAFRDRTGLGLYILQVRLAGRNLSLQLAQIALKLGDPLGPADEPPLKAMSVFRVVTVMFVMFVMLTVSTRTAAAALGLAAAALAAA